MLPKQNSYLSTPMGFDRSFPGPLDKYQTFDTVDDLIDYANDNYYASYNGQIVSVVGDPVQYRIDGTSGQIIPLCNIITETPNSNYCLIYKAAVGSSTSPLSTSLNRLGNGVNDIYSLLNFLKITASRNSLYLKIHVKKGGYFTNTSFNFLQEQYSTSKKNLCFEYVDDENSIYRFKNGTDTYLILPKKGNFDYDLEIYMPVNTGFMPYMLKQN